jgi:SAM-dependent methyltransferase
MTLRCRACDAPLTRTFCDLGGSPLSNAYLERAALDAPETFYPLHARVCDACFLVQVPAFESPQAIFGDYAYFSSFADSWLAHAKAFAEAAVARYGLGPGSRVVEVASNDGYLLQYFKALGIPVLGVEPAANVAEAARAKGIPTRVEFFGRRTAAALVAEHGPADLLVGNNVLAHVPDLNDFVGGLATALAPAGVLTMEFPHLLRLIEETQFDTIYHEHFSYLSLVAVEAVFARHGLHLFDVEELPTHGGSLRIHARRSPAPASERLVAVRAAERAARLDRIEGYVGFEERVQAVKRDLLAFLIEARRAGRTVAGYGAPAKGNTLLNYCGVKTDLLAFTVDRSPHKQGLYLPGTHLPILHPDHIRRVRPDYVLILPWNLRDEVMDQMRDIRDWGGRFVVPIPTTRVLD